MWQLVTQGRLGSASIGGFTLPLYSWAMFSPRNIQTGQPVGNSWPTNWGEGLQSTRWQVEFMLRDNAAEALDLAFWQMFTLRAWTLGQDDTVGQTLALGSGRKVRTTTNTKWESFTLRWAAGAPIGLSAVFLAPGKPTTVVTQTAVSYPEPYSNSQLLMFDALTTAGSNEYTYSGSISASNNHAPNKPQDGTKTIDNWDAGSMTCSASLKFREYPAVPFADNSQLSIALAALSGSRLFTLASCTINDPDDAGGVGVGQVYVEKQVIVNGTPSDPPLTIS